MNKTLIRGDEPDKVAPTAGVDDDKVVPTAGADVSGTAENVVGLAEDNESAGVEQFDVVGQQMDAQYGPRGSR